MRSRLDDDFTCLGGRLPEYDHGSRLFACGDGGGDGDGGDGPSGSPDGAADGGYGGGDFGGQTGDVSSGAADGGYGGFGGLGIGNPGSYGGQQSVGAPGATGGANLSNTSGEPANAVDRAMGYIANAVAGQVLGSLAATGVAVISQALGLAPQAATAAASVADMGMGLMDFAGMARQADRQSVAMTGQHLSAVNAGPTNPEGYGSDSGSTPAVSKAQEGPSASSILSGATDATTTTTVQDDLVAALKNPELAVNTLLGALLGRASTVRTGAQGVVGRPTVSRRSLLGA